MRTADKVAAYGADADSIDLWAAILGDTRAAATITGLGREVRTMPAAQLGRLVGMTATRAARMVAAVELGRRLMTLPLIRGQPIRCAQDVVDVVGHGLLDLEREVIAAVYLDVRNRLICREVVSVGSLTQCSVSPADLLRTAVRVAAAGYILLHTHPSSGDPAPSPDDDALTTRLAEASRFIGIQLVDHVIVGDGRHFSYADHHKLQPGLDLILSRGRS
jgi:DNA repair protein RadC